MSDELQKLLEQVHDGITTFNFDDKITPCIVIEEKNMMKYYQRSVDSQCLLTLI